MFNKLIIFNFKNEKNKIKYFSIFTVCGLLTAGPKGLILAVGGSTASLSGPVLVDGFTLIKKIPLIRHTILNEYSMY